MKQVNHGLSLWYVTSELSEFKCLADLAYYKSCLLHLLEIFQSEILHGVRNRGGLHSMALKLFFLQLCTLYITYLLNLCNEIQ